MTPRLLCWRREQRVTVTVAIVALVGAIVLPASPRWRAAASML
jgi:hypothetical protein